MDIFVRSEHIKIIVFFEYMMATIGLAVFDYTHLCSMSHVEPNSYEVMPFDLSSTNYQPAEPNEISQSLLHIFHFLARQKNITSPDESSNGDMHTR